jgi:probable addiction module antidote protein
MGKIMLRPWDSAEHLKTVEDMALYLDACLEEGDPVLITSALGVIARARGMTQLARDMEVSGEDQPEFATVMKVIKALGFRLHVESTRG